MADSRIRGSAPQTGLKPSGANPSARRNLIRPFVSAADRQDGQQRVQQLRAKRPAQPPSPSAAHATAPTAGANHPLANAGRWISDRAQDLDGLVRNTTQSIEGGLSSTRHAAGDLTKQLVRSAVEPLQTHPQGRALSHLVRGTDAAVDTMVQAGDQATHLLGGVVRGASGIVTGPVSLVGGGLQVAGDEGVRADTLQTLDGIRRDPAGFAVALKDAAVQSATRDPSGFVGEFVGNLIPVGAVTNGLGKLGTAARVADTTADVSRLARAADNAADAAGLARAADNAADAARLARGADNAADAARLTRGADYAADGQRVAQVASQAPSGPVPLPSASEYRHLFEQQALLGKVSLDNVPRPGIANITPDGEVAILQGAGRFEKARPGEMLDLFVPQGARLPKGSNVVSPEVDPASVRYANLLSSRGSAGTNPELIEYVTRGFSGEYNAFQRVLIPYEKVTAPTSKIGHLVRSGEKALGASLGSPEAAARALGEHASWQGSLVNRLEVLKEFGVIVSGGNGPGELAPAFADLLKKPR